MKLPDPAMAGKKTTMLKSVVFTKQLHAWQIVVTNRNANHHRLTAHLAIFGILLFTLGAIYKQLHAFAAIWAARNYAF
tara:strand:- start:318 stop:551 length:234 start_codon:yes stop_codon:yes gene_type:complete